MAPYRHFADKEALLAAVAEYGFQQLGARFATKTGTAANPRSRLMALGVAYVQFARDEPSLFKLMFGPTIEKKSAHPGLDEAGWACFNALRQAVAMAGFFDDEAALNDVSLACWSLVHGLSALIVDGRLVDKGVGPPEAIATRLTRLLIGALAALADVKRQAAGSNARNRTGLPAPTRPRRKKATGMIGRSALQSSPK
jgi:AcrR family transcriptional regulator